SVFFTVCAPVCVGVDQDESVCRFIVLVLGRRYVYSGCLYGCVCVCVCVCVSYPISIYVSIRAEGLRAVYMSYIERESGTLCVCVCVCVCALEECALFPMPAHRSDLPITRSIKSLIPNIHEIASESCREK